MGGMDGIATLRKLRELDAHLPVIILTGHGSFQDAVAGIHLEVVEFLQKPVDVDKLSSLIRTLLKKGRPGPLRERTIADLMVPVESYSKVFADEPIAAAIKALQESFFQQVTGKVAEQGHRSILVYDRKGDFLGLVRIADVVALCIPTFLRGSPYATCFTGMFLAQCKTIGNLKVADLLGEPLSIDVDAPLMEAVSLLTAKHQINLPVMRNERLVGILRDKDILLEVADHVRRG
jgi:CBS domain-containing protein